MNNKKYTKKRKYKNKKNTRKVEQPYITSHNKITIGGGPKKKSTKSKTKEVEDAPTNNACPELIDEEVPKIEEQKYVYYTDNDETVEGNIDSGYIIIPLRKSDDDPMFEINIETQITYDFKNYLTTYIKLCAKQNILQAITRETIVTDPEDAKEYSLDELIRQHPHYKYYMINTGENKKTVTEEVIRINKQIVVVMTFIMNFLSVNLFKIFIDDGLSLEHNETIINALINMKNHVNKDSFIYHVCKQISINLTLENPLVILLTRYISHIMYKNYKDIEFALHHIFVLMIPTISNNFPYIATIFSIKQKINNYLQGIGLIDENNIVIVSNKPPMLDITINNKDTDLSVIDKIFKRYIIPQTTMILRRYPENIELFSPLPLNALQMACTHKSVSLVEYIFDDVLSKYNMDIPSNINKVSVTGYKLTDIVLKQHYANEQIMYFNNKMNIMYEFENNKLEEGIVRTDQIFQIAILRILYIILEKLSEIDQYNMLNCPNKYGYTFAHFCALYNYNIVLNEIQKKYPVERYISNEYLKTNITNNYEITGILEDNGDLYPTGIAKILNNRDVYYVLNISPPNRIKTKGDEEHLRMLEQKAEETANALFMEEIEEKQKKVIAKKAKEDAKQKQKQKTQKNLPPVITPPPAPAPAPVPPTEPIPEPLTEVITSIETTSIPTEKKKRIRKKKDKPVSEGEIIHPTAEETPPTQTIEPEISTDILRMHTIEDIDNATILTTTFGRSQLPNYMDSIFGYNYNDFRNKIVSFIRENIDKNEDIDDKIREQIPHYTYESATFKIHNEEDRKSYKNKVYALLITMNALNRHFSENGLCSVIIKGGTAAQLYIDNPSRDIDVVLIPSLQYKNKRYEYVNNSVIRDIDFFHYSTVIATVLRDIADFLDNKYLMKINKNTYDECYKAVSNNNIGSNNVQKLYIGNIGIIDISIGFNSTIKETPDMYYLYEMVENVSMFSIINENSNIKWDGYLFFQNMQSQIYEKFIYIVKYYTSGKYVLIYTSGVLTEEQKRHNADRAYANKSIATIQKLFQYIRNNNDNDFAKHIEDTCRTYFFDKYRDMKRDITIQQRERGVNDNKKQLYHPGDMIEQLIQLCFYTNPRIAKSKYK